jgi:uncharacterized membrane protein YqgA involved in biofilm formation
MTGTVINVIAVLVGSAAGMLLGARFPERVRQTVMGALGIMTLVIGIGMAISGNALIVLFSLLLGGIVGEILRLDDRLNALGKMLEERFARPGSAGNFTRGFVTASLVYCVGPLAILGSIQDGLLGDYRLLAVKSLLDAFASLAFASALGVGVAFSAIVVFCYQGAISLASMGVGSALGSVTRTTPWVIQFSATGGAMLIGISLILLDIKRLRVANYTPAIFIAPLIQVLLELYKVSLP